MANRPVTEFDSEPTITPTRPALRYHGGKWRLAPWLLQHYPPHTVYIEPFGGGASVLLQKSRSPVEVYNDLDQQIVNFFRVLRDPLQAERLAQLVRLTPFSRDEFEEAYLAMDRDAVREAHRTVVRAYMGHGSDSATRGCRTGFRYSGGASRASPANDWAGWPEGVEALTARLRGVVIENMPAAQLLARYDSPDTLVYADPPYVPSTRTGIVRRSRGNGYRHEMTDDDHQALAETLRAHAGMVVLSGYPSALYDRELYADWERHERPHVADRGLARTEVVWLNPACSSALAHHRRQQQLFEGGA